MSDVEPFASRWKRRSRTIPTMLAATAAGLVGSPIIIAAAIASDLVKRRRRFPSVRVALFAIQYTINDSVEILLSPVLWLLAGFGTRLDRPTSIRRHEQLQAWSIGVMARRAERLLGIRVDIEERAANVLTPGPVIVLCRHVNIVDASLPTLIYQRLGYRTRGLIMTELLADPGFDLIYRRTGSVFIPRDNGPEALALMRHLHDGIDSSTAVVIFPEGRLFRPELLTRFLTKLEATNPDRGRRLVGLRHVLPPRPGGVLTLLDAIPQADVVTIAHAGLDQYGSFSDLARAAPLDDPINVTAWRTPAKDIPTDPSDRIAWLDEQWLRVDQWIHDQSNNTASHLAESSIT
ncbi:MAG: 1-acyl-sn-glycerol-3-phosphate acyltransferase [Ilumatobacteraceae bacterium]